MKILICPVTMDHFETSEFTANGNTLINRPENQESWSLGFRLDLFTRAIVNRHDPWLNIAASQVQLGRVIYRIA